MPSVVRPAVLATLLVGLLGASAQARFRMPEEVPVERLVKNLEARLTENEGDANAHYVLARVHSLALTRRSASIRVYLRKDELPFVDHQFHGTFDDDGAELAEDALRKHLAAAVKHFAEALRLAPGSARTHLGLAYTLEVGGLVARTAPPGAKPPQGDEKARLEALAARITDENAAVRASARKELLAAGGASVTVLAPCLDAADPDAADVARDLIATLWRERAIREYLTAFTLSVEEDVEIEHRPLSGLRSLVSYEAGTLYKKLVTERGVRAPEKAHVARIDEALTELAGKPRGPITPIVFPLDRARPLASLLDPNARVRFDLDGDGVPREWTWVRPETGILVWDPAGTGRVSSGRQLFGNVTWWLFWDDGYRALDALDDDRDGWLSGAELAGLAVWRDADQDGASDGGEVVALGEAGVTGLSVRAARPAAGVPWSERGVRLEGGRVLPSYDWIATPASRE